jgi:hypothetical protein
MARLKPWFHVVQPREDLREGKPLDASEFAVHLDQVRDDRAPEVYRKPEQFFERTYLTQSLTDLAAQAIRRLSGEKTETSAVFNMATQFGGGKTHALTLLYHLATHGPDANRWMGVRRLLDKSGMSTVPRAAVAVFVGTEFDSLSGRGGDDGTPVRKTPWGEIAFQLGGEEALAVLVEHEKQLTAPAGDIIRKFLPKDKPCLILMDELMNYVSRNRKSGMATQLYDFLQILSEEARGCNNVVLVVSIPASELEMSADDHSDYERFKKMLDRLGKAVMMSAEAETSEIIRRRLFEWDERAVSQDGKVLLSRDALQTCSEYAAWVIEHRHQLPAWFPIDHARDAFAATYPFHPLVLSVFERKWQALPRFQRTRGILRLLALWVSRAYQEGFKGAQRDALIGLGTAPLDDPFFRAATFEQLGEPRREAAVTTDICGKQESHAVRLDREAVDTIKKARLHRKVATAIFFESNGGQLHAEATVPEIRLAVAEPELDIGNVETVLETSSSACYFLSVERNRYRFSLSPNLNKLLADRRANISPSDIKDRVRAEIQKVFSPAPGVERMFFPENSSKILDRAVLTLVILASDQSLQDEKNIVQVIDAMTRECGTSSRTFKSALVWCVADSASSLREEARKLLAWEAIQDEADSLRLEEGQQRQLAENLKKSQRDLREAVWRTYKNLFLLGKDNTMRPVDLGLVHSSAADTMVTLILNRLRQDGEVQKDISPNFLTRTWPPAFQEWSTKSVREMFFASPQFPRLLNADVIKETITRGVANGLFAYVGKSPNGGYEPFCFGTALTADDVEIAEDMYIITKETAEQYKANDGRPAPEPSPNSDSGEATDSSPVVVPASNSAGGNTPDVPTIGSPVINTMRWSGEVPSQRWMNFYTKVLSKFATGQGLKLTLSVEVSPDGGIPAQKIEETRLALRELSLNDDVETT